VGHLLEQGPRERGNSAALEASAQALAERFAWRQGAEALAAADIYATLTLARPSGSARSSLVEGPPPMRCWTSASEAGAGAIG
jgi:hypothetical protein